MKLAWYFKLPWGFSTWKRKTKRLCQHNKFRLAFSFLFVIYIYFITSIPSTRGTPADRNTALVTSITKVTHPANNMLSTLPTINAVLLVRIYAKDKAKWGRREIDQWLQYMRYAGIGRVYMYDAYHSKTESLQQWSLQYPFVTYIDWSAHSNPYSIKRTQVAAYQHAIDTYGSASDWQIAFDMDEYPFSPIDTTAAFLRRVVHNLAVPGTSELSVKNFLFLGNSTSGSTEWVVERIVRRTIGPANNLDKPIYRPHNVRAQVHHNKLISGRSVDVDPSLLRMNHYWGQRLENWGEPCTGVKGCLTFEEMIKKTVYDNSASSIALQIKKSDH